MIFIPITLGTATPSAGFSVSVVEVAAKVVVVVVVLVLVVVGAALRRGVGELLQEERTHDITRAAAHTAARPWRGTMRQSSSFTRLGAFGGHDIWSLQVVGADATIKNHREGNSRVGHRLEISRGLDGEHSGRAEVE